jgi:hypothetical protein
MKHFTSTIPAIALILLTFSAPAYSAEKGNRHEWTVSDTLVEALFATLVYVDWKQTIEFTQNPDKYPNCFETNPLLGKHPSRSEINAVIGGSLLAHALIARSLSQPYRGWWQFLWIGIEADVIHTNRVVVGVSTSF